MQTFGTCAIAGMATATDSNPAIILSTIRLRQRCPSQLVLLLITPPSLVEFGVDAF
jgi:hypothetical protein